MNRALLHQLRHVALHYHDRRWMRFLARTSEALAASLTTPTHNFRTNGETRVLAALGVEARHVLDVGAHYGYWAQEAARHCPRATIHCFEISAQIRDLLRANVTGLAIINDYGLADMAKHVKVKRFLTDDHLTSLFDYPHASASVWNVEWVDTGDAYLSRSRIERVDLLKIDAEGAEHLVLAGFKESINERRIRCIQFEYGRINILRISSCVTFISFSALMVSSWAKYSRGMSLLPSTAWMKKISVAPIILPCWRVKRS